MIQKDEIIIDGLNSDQALAMMNKIIEIHNDLLSSKPEFGWVKLGMLIERLAQKNRNIEKEK